MHKESIPIKTHDIRTMINFTRVTLIFLVFLNNLKDDLKYFQIWMWST